MTALGYHYLCGFSAYSGIVIPAFAGIHVFNQEWIPAFAGVTGQNCKHSGYVSMALLYTRCACSDETKPRLTSSSTAAVFR